MFRKFQLGLGILVTESKVSSNNDLSKLFHKCKDYIIFTCQGNNWSEKVDDLCQVGYFSPNIIDNCMHI